MAKKIKLSKLNIVLIVILTLLLTSVCIFVIKNKQKHETPKYSPSELEQIEIDINKDVVNNIIRTEYNGNYKFSSVVDISFEEDLTNAEQKEIFKSISGAKDKNTFATYLYNNKKSSSSGEIICFNDGAYSKSKNNSVVEKGLYYGNLNKSYVYVQNKNGTVIINNTPHSIDFEISKTAYWSSKNISQSETKIFIREKYYYDEVNDKFLYVTYSYEKV